MLHRDIYWLGRQWCVTGFGLQVIDSRWEMRFDIPAARLWDDHLSDGLSTEPWFDAEDFAQALERARLRSNENPRAFAPPLTNER